MTAFFNGLMITGGLIIAIGAQNAFVLKQGLLKQNIGIVVLLCWLCDFVLIACGTFGVSALFSQNSTASLILSASGGIFLLLYGLAGLKRAFRANNALIVAAGNKIDPPTAWKTATATLAITLLNPHVYIDTIMLIGGSAAALSFQEKWYFLSGALMTSAIWFCSIGFGARLLLPLFRRETTWQILDLIIAVMMFYLSYNIALTGLGNTLSNMDKLMKNKVVGAFFASTTLFFRRPILSAERSSLTTALLRSHLI